MKGILGNNRTPILPSKAYLIDVENRIYNPLERSLTQIQKNINLIIVNQRITTGSIDYIYYEKSINYAKKNDRF